MMTSDFVCFSQISGSLSTEFLLESRFEELARLCRRRGLIAPGPPPEWLRQSYSQFLHHRELLRLYRPKHLNDRAILLQQQRKEGLEDPTCGWKKWIADPYIISISGDHFSIVTEPHVAELAREILCLNELS